MITRREFFLRSGIAALVAPTMPKLAYEAVKPGQRDATRWLQRKIDGLRPGQTLRVPPGRYRISDALHIRGKHGIGIDQLEVTMEPTAPHFFDFSDSTDVLITDCAWFRA